MTICERAKGGDGAGRKGGERGKKPRRSQGGFFPRAGKPPIRAGQLRGARGKPILYVLLYKGGGHQKRILEIAGRRLLGSVHRPVPMVQVLVLQKIPSSAQCSAFQFIMGKFGGPGVGRLSAG